MLLCRSILYTLRQNRMYINHCHFWPAGVSNSERAASNSQHTLLSFIRLNAFRELLHLDKRKQTVFYSFVQFTTNQIHIRLDRCLILKTYPRPRHPNLLATSRCKSPSKRDLSSGEKESGNSTFWRERRNRKRLMSLTGISLNTTLCRVSLCLTFTRCLLLFH